MRVYPEFRTDTSRAAALSSKEFFIIFLLVRGDRNVSETMTFEANVGQDFICGSSRCIMEKRISSPFYKIAQRGEFDVSLLFHKWRVYLCSAQMVAVL